ncbi:MAG TPA: zinc ribbon domain-containing protein [Candidatus Eisenbacteria bacterium]|nr:zinc ribbon domain-containing protein [Candidatus Eisenbacteria bacterium]
MPIYEYECGKCGVFEHSQRITDAALTKCPTCRRKVRRIISNTSFQLKGSGWYVTDYARSGDAKKGDGAADGGASKSESKSETTSESKSESKPEAKSDTKPSSKAKSGSGTTAKAS